MCSFKQKILIGVVLISFIPSTSYAKPKSLTLEQVRKEVNCLALNVYHEARGLDLRQQAAVANATMNRLLDPKRPKTVCGIVYQKHQYSWTFQLKDKKAHDLVAWVKAKTIAELVYQDQIPDITKGSMYYYNDKKVKQPKWAKKMEVRYTGDHIFLAMK